MGLTLKMILKYVFLLIAIFTFQIDEVKSSLKTLAKLDENCPDINLARECENNCGSDMVECLEDCGEDNVCSSSCYREQVICMDSCPCHADCPMGCKNCSNAICENKLALVIYNLGVSQFSPFTIFRANESVSISKLKKMLLTDLFPVEPGLMANII